MSVLGLTRHLIHKKPKRPFYLIHFVRGACNARCKHCLVDDAVGEQAVREELSLDEIERFCANSPGLIFAFLTGGEPFLREDLPEIATAYARLAGTRKLQIPSNGSKTARMVRFAETVPRSCPDLHTSISISLDGVGEDHDRIRRTPGLFEKAIESYRQLRRIADRCDNLDVNITTTVTGYNQDKLDELASFVLDELGCENYFNTLVRGRTPDPASSKVDLNRFEAFNDTLERALHSGRMPGYKGFPLAGMVNAKNLISRRLIEATARDGQWRTPCYAGAMAAVLQPDGEVAPCELLENTLGNIRDHNYDIAPIWASERARAMRRQIEEERCRCTHECFTTVNVLFNLRFWPQLMLETGRLRAARWASRA